MPVSDAENRLSLMYVAGILPHAKALFDATSIESNSPSRPVLAKIYAFFLTYCVEILGCDHNVAFLCSDTLSAGTDDNFSIEITRNLATYIARWDRYRLHLADRTDDSPKNEDLPVLFSVVVQDLQSVHAFVSPSILLTELTGFMQDLSEIFGASETPNVSAPATTPAQNSPSSIAKRSPSHKHSFADILIAGFLLFGLVVCFLLFSGNIDSIFPSSSSSLSSSSTDFSSSRMTAPIATPSPISKPSTGILWYKGKNVELAPFDVTASGNRDYVLLLAQNNKAVRSYYIRHGETLSVLVPLGTYQVYYACATIHSSWYGRTDLWKSQTEYYKSQDSLDFELSNGYYYGYTLELSVSSMGGSDYAYESSESAWDSLF